MSKPLTDDAARSAAYAYVQKNAAEHARIYVAAQLHSADMNPTALYLLQTFNERKRAAADFAQLVRVTTERNPYELAKLSGKMATQETLAKETADQLASFRRYLVSVTNEETVATAERLGAKTDADNHAIDCTNRNADAHAAYQIAATIAQNAYATLPPGETLYLDPRDITAIADAYKINRRKIKPSAILAAFHQWNANNR